MRKLNASLLLGGVYSSIGVVTRPYFRRSFDHLVRVVEDFRKLMLDRIESTGRGQQVLPMTSSCDCLELCWSYNNISSIVVGKWAKVLLMREDGLRWRRRLFKVLSFRHHI
jgi:hypothetical protein